jgi:HK97 family phage major capsid protein
VNVDARAATAEMLAAFEAPKAANAFSIAFGDFRRGYQIVDRQGGGLLRDPYSLEPYVLFYTIKRAGAGGGVQNLDAIKLMKFAASLRKRRGKVMKFAAS